MGRIGTPTYSGLQFLIGQPSVAQFDLMLVVRRGG